MIHDVPVDRRGVVVHSYVDEQELLLRSCFARVHATVLKEELKTQKPLLLLEYIIPTASHVHF